MRILREIREGQKLSQTALARKSGVSQPHIHDIEAGKKQPGIEVIRKLAKALGVPPSRLLDDAEDEMAATRAG